MLTNSSLDAFQNTAWFGMELHDKSEAVLDHQLLGCRWPDSTRNNSFKAIRLAELLLRRQRPCLQCSSSHIFRYYCLSDHDTDRDCDGDVDDYSSTTTTTTTTTSFLPLATDGLCLAC